MPIRIVACSSEHCIAMPCCMPQPARLMEDWGVHGRTAPEHARSPSPAVPQVARLKAAGAFLLGKGNMGEWAFSPTFSLSSVGGAVRNPYDLDRTPAGSSGGPAAGA